MSYFENAIKSPFFDEEMPHLKITHFKEEKKYFREKHILSCQISHSRHI